MKSHTPPELRELIASVLNGDATPEQTAQLEAQLLESEAARDFYIDYVNLHAELRRHFLASQDQALQLSVEELAEFRQAVAVECYPQPRRAWLRSMLLAVAAIAAALLLAVVWRPWSQPFADAVATIRSLDGEATLVSARQSRLAAVGDALRPGETLRVSSEIARAVIEYPDGTRVQLHSGAAVQSPADQKVRLQLLAGSMEVDAAKQPADHPLIFATKQSHYVVLGTRFRLYQEQNASRLELDEGKVRLEQLVSGETVEVEAGSVAIADEHSPVEILPLSAGQAELLHVLPKAGQKVEFSGGGSLLTSNWQSGLHVWRLDDYSLVEAYPPDAGGSDGLALTEEGRVIQVNRNGYVLAWTPGEKEALKLPLSGKHTRSRTLSPDGSAAVVSSEDGTSVYRIAAADRELIEQLHLAPSGKAWCLALTPEGKELAAGYWDGTINVHAVANGEVVFTRKLQHTPTHIDISADGRRIVVATQRDGLLLIDLESGEQKALWPPGANIVRCLRFSIDGRRVLAGLNDRTARIWSVADGRQLLVIEAGHAPQGIAWSEEKQVLATADGAVKLWQCHFQAAGDKEGK
jgi:ferric-dicitrate binding protein FerR (iron transport regulator)